LNGFKVAMLDSLVRDGLVTIEVGDTQNVTLISITDAGRLAIKGAFQPNLMDVPLRSIVEQPLPPSHEQVSGAETFRKEP
jgi:hypothetical protein